MKMIQSVEKHAERKFVKVSELVQCQREAEVWVRGRVHTSRCKGKQCFLVLRQQSSTVQCLLAVNETVSKQMVKFSGSIPRESIIDLRARVIPVEQRIESCTEQTLELHVLELFLLSAAKAQLPLQIEDASRPEKSDDPEALKIRVNQDTRLDNRVLDLRTPANQAIFRLEAGVCKLFRDVLTAKGFTEIHTPKIISAASEGGANVFTVSYFKGSSPGDCILPPFGVAAHRSIPTLAFSFSYCRFCLFGSITPAVQTDGHCGRFRQSVYGRGRLSCGGLQHSSASDGVCRSRS